jgi:hypothetical protein
VPGEAAVQPSLIAFTNHPYSSPMGQLMSEEERKEQLRLEFLLPLAIACWCQRKIAGCSDTAARDLSTATAHEGQSWWDMAECRYQQ